MATVFNNLYICLWCVCCISLNSGQMTQTTRSNNIRATPGPTQPTTSRATQAMPGPTPINSCGPAPRILGGAAVISESGRSANYRCDRGYYMRGQPQVMCQASGRWADTPTCRVRYCRTPTRPGRSSFRYPGGGYIVGTVITFTCNYGYELIDEVGDGSILCLSNFTWTNNTARCQKKECGEPVDIENGNYTLLTNTTNYASRVVYTCHEGYTMRSSNSYSRALTTATLSCTSQGSWSRAPSCQPRTCGFPPYVSYAITSARIRTHYYGDLFDYDCAIGYRLVGNTSVACGKDGKWSVHPVCLSVTCGDPPAVANAVIHSGADKRFNSKALYTCQVGYAARGALSIVCLLNGNWSFTPTCELVMCRNPPQIHNGNVTMLNDTTQYDAHALYKCDSGFKLIGIENIRCKSSGDWETPPSCETSPGSTGNQPKSSSQFSHSDSGPDISGSLIGLAIACTVLGLIVLVLLAFIVIKLTCLKKGGSNWVQMQ